MAENGAVEAKLPFQPPSGGYFVEKTVSPDYWATDPLEIEAYNSVLASTKEVLRRLVNAMRRNMRRRTG
jgi:hypothetical protein